MAKSIIERALAQLEAQVREARPAIIQSADVRAYARLRLATSEREVFAALFLDAQNRMIEFDELFFGTIDACTIHPREVAKAALACNAAAVIFAHNHPSGVANPSRADVAITEKLRSALALFDIRVLDHIVVTKLEAVSMLEKGLL